MRLKWLAAVAALVFSTAATAIPPLPPPPPPQAPVATAPKLLVVISVDEFSADLFDEYRPQFTGGLARLATGTAFHNGYQSHAATETCPGHSTIMTGDHPSRTGIIANQWIDQSAARADKSVYCAEDETAPGTDSNHYKVSAMHLKVPTLGDLLKQRSLASRNVAVAGKDRAAVMMSGHKVDQRWYWDGKAFTTDLAVQPPRSIAATNSVVAQAIARPREPLVPPPFCTAKAQPIAIDGHAPVGAGTFGRKAGDSAGFRASPEYDGAILALSAGLVREMQLGKRPAPDLLSIGLSATDYVGHTYGTEGQEMCLNLLELDREVGDFLAFLDRSGINYAVALTADHGGEDLPERLRLKGNDLAQRVDSALTAANIGATIGAKLKLSNPVLLGDVFGDIYVNRALSVGDRSRALAEAVRVYRAHPQVAAVFTSEEIQATPMPTGDAVRWTLLQRARASFDPQRSGDLYVVLKEHVTPIGHAAGSVATHGSPWDYDRRVPILFWRQGFIGATVEQPAETTDIMPTLAAMLGLGLPAGAVDGHCLEAAPGVTCSLR